MQAHRLNRNYCHSYLLYRNDVWRSFHEPHSHFDQQVRNACILWILQDQQLLTAEVPDIWQHLDAFFYAALSRRILNYPFALQLAARKEIP